MELKTSVQTVHEALFLLCGRSILPSLPLDICVCGWMESKVVAPNGGTPLCSLRVMVFCEAICNCALIELVFYLIRCALLILAMWKTFKQEAIKYLQV